MRRTASANRVAYRYMKKAGLLKEIVNLFKSPEKNERPKFDVSKIWVLGGQYGATQGWVLRELKMGNNNVAVIDHNGVKLKLTIGGQVLPMKDNGGLKGNFFHTISLTGMEENIPKRDLDKALMSIVKEARWGSDFYYTQPPKTH